MPASQLPNSQSLSSKTFKSVYPLLVRGDFPVPDLCDWIAENSPEHPFFVYHDNLDNTLHHILWREVNKGFNRAAHYFVKRVGPMSNQSASPPVVAILASTGMSKSLSPSVASLRRLDFVLDSITYFSSMMGVVRAGFTAFLISPRNGPDAVAHLIRKTQSQVLFTSSEAGIQTLAKKAIALLSNSTEEPLTIPQYPMPVFEDLYSSGGDPSLDTFPKQIYDLDAPAYILHSSGTLLPQVLCRELIYTIF